MSNVPPKPPGSTIPSPPPPPGASVPADLLDAFADDVSEQLTILEDATAALRQLAASMQREADRTRASKP